MLATTGVKPRQEIGRYNFHLEHLNATKDCKFSEYAKFVEGIVKSIDFFFDDNKVNWILVWRSKFGILLRFGTKTPPSGIEFRVPLIAEILRYWVTKRNNLSEWNTLYTHTRKHSTRNIELNCEPKSETGANIRLPLDMNEVLHLVFSTSNIIIHRILFPCHASYWEGLGSVFWGTTAWAALLPTIFLA